MSMMLWLLLMEGMLLVHGSLHGGRTQKQPVGTTHGSYTQKQPMGSLYFDSIIHHAVAKYRGAGVVLSTIIPDITRQLQEIYAGCMLKEEARGRIKLTINGLYPWLCGSIGYANPNPTVRTWTIERLATTFGIKLFVERLSLPFIGVNCRYANLTVTPSRHHVLCGNKSKLALYSAYSAMVVELRQDYIMPVDCGFFAVYSAIEHHLIPSYKATHLSMMRGTAIIRHPFYIYEKSVGDTSYSWHIAAEPFQRIHLPRKKSLGVTVHDGPWEQSPILHGNLTSGNCAYVVQASRHPEAEYKAVTHTNYERNHDIHLVASSTRNTVRAYEVPAGAQSLVIHSLNVQYMGMMGYLFERCQYGGLFVYTKHPFPRGDRYFKMLEFCQTRLREPFTFQLTDDLSKGKFYVYVSLYAAYSIGEIRAVIKPRKCRIINRELYFGCNVKYFILWPHRNFTFTVNGINRNIGPIDVKVRVVNLLYSVEPQAVSVQYNDQNIFQQNKVISTVNVSGVYQQSLENPQMIDLFYRPGILFNSLNVVTLELDTCGIMEQNYNVQGTKHIAIFLMKASFTATITGSTYYLIDFIATSPMYASLQLFYAASDNSSDRTCNDLCGPADIRVLGYIQKRHQYFTFVHTQLPLFSANTITKGSFQVKVKILHKKCEQCVLKIQVSSVEFLRWYLDEKNDRRNETQLELIQPKSAISWNMAKEDCESSGRVLLEPNRLEDYLPYFHRELEYRLSTGYGRNSYFFLVLPKQYKAYTDLLFVTGLIQKLSQTKAAGSFLVTNMEDLGSMETLDKMPRVMFDESVTAADGGNCYAFTLANNLNVGTWIRVSCTAAIPASYICAQNLATALAPAMLFNQNVSTAYRRSISRDNVSSIQQPTVHCPFPWLAAENVCVRMVRVRGEAAVMRDDWLDAVCAASLNASVFRMPTQHYGDHGAFHPGINSQGDVFFAICSIVRHIGIYNRVFAFLDDDSNECVYYHYHAVTSIRQNCTLPLSPFPRNFYVACIRSFGASNERYGLETFECESGSLIAQAFYCNGNRECMSGDDESKCEAVIRSAKDCSPLTLSSHKDSTCASWCPSLYVPCSDGKCIPLDALCNAYVDCEDGWDEAICDSASYLTPLLRNSSIIPQISQSPSTTAFNCLDKSRMDGNQLCIYDLDPMGGVVGCADMSHLVLCEYVGCPHAYKCRANYCIPVRRVCDGVVDCTHGDDEVACEDHICPGMLQCRGSGVCIPPWEVCDGRVHCLEFQEDEIYCDACPTGLSCHGRAALCSGHTPVTSLPRLLRALVCTNQMYPDIIHQRLESLSVIFLDVRNNSLSSADLVMAFESLPNVLYIDATNNSLLRFPSPRQSSCSAVRVLILAFNRITEFASFGLQVFCELQVLVVHHNRISVLQHQSFLAVRSLRSLDLTHNPLLQVMDLPHSPFLHWVESNRLLVCCLLPTVEKCLPVSDAFSSCKNLLHNMLHRVLIYGQALLTTLLNCLVIGLQRHLNKKEHNQIIQLTVGNLFMAAYLGLIAAVDTSYIDSFNLIAISWKYSAICKMLASFNFIGSEVPLSLLLYMSIHRAYSITSLKHAIAKSSAWTACFTIWITWVLYAAGLLITIDIYEISLDNNACIFIHFASKLSGNTIIFIQSTLFVLVNTVLVALLFVFYGTIAWRVKRAGKSVVGQVHSKTRQRVVSFRLSVILLFTVLCWFPMLLCQLLSLLGVFLPDTVSVWMAILVLPINALFSPIMFAIIPTLTNIRKDRLKRQKRKRNGQ